MKKVLKVIGIILLFVIIIAAVLGMVLYFLYPNILDQYLGTSFAKENTQVSKEYQSWTDTMGGEDLDLSADVIEEPTTEEPLTEEVTEESLEDATARDYRTDTYVGDLHLSGRRNSSVSGNETQASDAYVNDMGEDLGDGVYIDNQTGDTDAENKEAVTDKVFIDCSDKLAEDFPVNDVDGILGQVSSYLIERYGQSNYEYKTSDYVQLNDGVQFNCTSENDEVSAIRITRATSGGKTTYKVRFTV